MLSRSHKAKTSPVPVTAALLSLVLSSCVVVPYSADDVLIEWKKTINQARAKQNQKDFPAAEEAFLKARDLVHKDPSLDLFEALTLRELGSLEIDAKNDDRARDYLKQSNTLFDSTRKKDADAYSIYTKKHFDGLYQLGKLEERNKHYNESEQYLKAALTTDAPESDKEACRTDLILLQEKLNRDNMVLIPPAITEKIDALGKQHSDPATLTYVVFSTARGAAADDKTNEGKQLLAALLQYFRAKNDKHSELRAMSYFIAYAYGTDDLPLASALSTRALTISKDPSLSNFQSLFLAQSSLILLKGGNSDTSSKTFQKARHQSDGDRTNKEIADILMAMGDLDANSSKNRKFARKAYSRAVELTEELPSYKETADRAKIKLAEAMARSDDFEDELALLLTMNPNSMPPELKTSYYLTLAANYRDLEKYQQAIKISVASVQSASEAHTKMHALLQFCSVYLASGDKAKARATFQQAKALRESLVKEAAKQPGGASKAIILPRGLERYYDNTESDVAEQ